MRMESRQSAQITVFLTMAFVFIAMISRTSGQEPSVGKPNPFEPSPLVQYSSSHVRMASLKQSRKYPSTINPLISQKVDLSKTLKKYAEIKNCSLDEAFAVTVDYLKMIPIRDFSESSQARVGTQAIYKIIEKDVYQITASQNFFDQLPQNLMCIENGKRHIMIETRFLTINPAEIESLQKFMIPSSFVAFTNKIPEAKPFATQATYRNIEPGSPPSSDAGTFVVATETKTTVHPSFMGRLDNAGLDKLLARVNELPGTEYTRTPRVTVLPGQIASVADTATQPVVVGLDRIVGDSATAHQPIIQTLENGSVMLMRATGENGSIRLDGDLALGEVTSVQKFQYPKIINADENPLFVAAPEFKLREVHWSAVVKKGQTILIDPVFTKEIKDSKSGLAFGRVVILVTPRFVDSEPQIRR